MSATARRPRLDPLHQEALLLRHQEAMDLLRHPDVAGVTDLSTTEQRVSLLAAVVWPSQPLLEWSLEAAAGKLAHRQC